MKLWRLIKAFFRWDLNVVCEASRGRWDFHDYKDSQNGKPQHFWPMECKRCRKEFFM